MYVWTRPSGLFPNSCAKKSSVLPSSQLLDLKPRQKLAALESKQQRGVSDKFSSGDTTDHLAENTHMFTRRRSVV